jgi:hypothetical protein
MAAKKSKATGKPSKRKITETLKRAARDYDSLCQALHRQILWNAASELEMAPEELGEEWEAMT